MLHFNMIGNMNTHLKTLKMKCDWEEKKASGNITGKKDPTVEYWQNYVDDMHGKGKDGDTDQVKLRDIHTKLQSGAKLTQEERSYLQAKDPESYRELVQEEQEQKAYEQALRRCKTKEEAERLKMSQLNKSMATVRSVEHNPNISMSKKLEIAMREQRKVNRVMESTRKFVESGEYEKLPTEAEYAEAMGEAQEEKAPAPEQEVSRQEGDVPSPESVDGTKEEPVADDTKPEKPEIREPEKPRIDLETESERKVRRARAKAAYTQVPADQGSGWTERA